MSVEHTDVAAYSLGLLEPGDSENFEAHIANCQSCPAEVAEFAGMAELFAGLGRVEVTDEQPDESAIADLVGRRAVMVRRQARRRGVLAAAACLVLLAAGVVTGVAVAPKSSVPSSSADQLTGVLHKGTNKATGITGTVGLVAKPWGTQVTLKLGDVKGPLDCELIAVSKTGVQRVMVGWLVPAAGYGVPGHPADLFIAGGTSISLHNLTRIMVDVVHGSTLLTIPI
jgi:hypothetical protein